MSQDPRAPLTRYDTVPAVSAVLDEDEYALFAEVGRLRRFHAGDIVMRRGVIGGAMYVVAHGAVELDFGGEPDARYVEACGFFGELGLLIEGCPDQADAVAIVDSLLIEVQRSDFDQLIDRHPGFGLRFMQHVLAHTVHGGRQRIDRLQQRHDALKDALGDLRTPAYTSDEHDEFIRTDELTGLLNRRGLDRHIAERRRSGALGNLGLLLIDCDRFHAFNDVYGHRVGDRLLQGVASLLNSAAGTDDVACRLGGDEFCLLVSARDREGVMRQADFLIGTAHGLVQVPQSPPLMCTLSIGGCLVTPGADWNAWYANAAAALARAKRLGGNRAEWSAPLSVEG
ncbi:diguanylate cyclase domain-containing protein [Lysobacter korlensis]|uniref:diguanylate cyclase n=1 Tax=Lysobacter korlensis TaxID=553636 RepID=A0ABV6RGY3_9GAMM